VAEYSMERTRSRRFSLRLCSGGAEEALQAAVQVGGLADVGRGLEIVAAKQEAGRRGWAAAKVSASRLGTNSRCSLSTDHFSLN